MRLTQKLLSFLNRVFDKAPEKFLVMRMSYGGGMTWQVADAVLTTTVTGGIGVNLTIDLTQYTVGQLIGYIAAQPGYSILYGDTSDLSILSARLLIEDANDISLSNGDHLYGYTNVLWSFMEAAANELQQAEAQIPNAIAQMSTKTAANEWLDELGSYYNVPRLQGETDASYGPRIIAEVLRPRGNNVAMEEAIKVFTGQTAKVTDVTLYGATFPLYNGTITRNSAHEYNASRLPIYGLFDVDYAYDLINGTDIATFKQTVTDLINRLRDAGTHLRSLLLSGSALSDTFTAPVDGATTWAADAEFSETLTAPSETFASAGVLAAFSDPVTPPTDAESITIVYAYKYNAIRHYNGMIFRVGGQTITESL